MKKILILIPLVFILITSGCSKKIEIIDYVQSNQGCNYFSPIMETDTGFYYNNYFRTNELSLYYYDKPTKQSIYLCAKPECLHDGNSFCPATNKNISSFHTTLYGNAIYFSGKDADKDDTLSLYRASLDGTELTKLTDVIKLSNGFYHVSANDYVSLVIHRGKAFVSYYANHNITSEITNWVREGILGGIVMVDLKTMKCDVVEEIISPLTSTYNPIELKAVDDYIYYRIKEINKSIIKRYHISDKTIEEFEIPRNTSSYVVIDSEIWYSYSNSIFDSCISIYNIESGETRQFEGDFTKYIPPEAVYGGELYDDKLENDENGFINIQQNSFYSQSEIMYDGQYLYVSNFGGLKGGNYFMDRADLKNPTIFVHMFTLDGKEVKRFYFEYGTGNNINPYSMNVIDGKVYIQYEDRIVSCTVEDILKNNIQWEIEFNRQDANKINDYIW